MTAPIAPRVRAGSARGPGGTRPDLRALMAKVATGDEQAFERLYEATAGPVLGMAQQVLRDRAQAEEVTQEVLWQVWREAARYRPDRSEVLTWVLTLAHRRAVDRVRSAQAAADRDRAAVLRAYTPPFDPVSEQVDRRLEHDRVRAALAGLTEVQRRCLLLVYFGGRTQAQAATELGTPLGTVKTRIRDALRKLRDELAEPAGTRCGALPDPRVRTGRRGARS